MNKKRRKRIQKIINTLNTCADELEEIKIEEDESRGNMPENMHDGERFSVSKGYSDTMENALDDIGGAKQNLENILEGG